MLEYKRFHFVGIGGIGMSGLAKLLLCLGYKVSGSDIKKSETTKALEKLGAKIFYKHAETNLGEAQVVVFSSAIKRDNPEIEGAIKRGLKLISRAEMLVEIMKLHEYNIAIAGAHGKTTTSSMVATLLSKAHFEPTVAVGGKVNGFAGNAWLGTRNFLVAEADESDGSFLKMEPNLAIITNIDREHLDFYKDFEHLKSTFLDFIKKIKSGGHLIFCIEDPILKELEPQIRRIALSKDIEIFTYGFAKGANLRAQILSKGGPLNKFEVFFNEIFLGSIKLSVYGEHNILNALAAIGVGLVLRIPFKKVKKGLESFSGVSRRMEIKAEEEGVLFIDDYAHHPTEIKATIKALKTTYPHRRLVVLFQPHRYTRTKELFENFVEAFDEVDLLFLTEIYPASEPPIKGVSGEILFQAIKDHRGQDTYYVSDKERLPEVVIPFIEKGDVVVSMGAGDIYKILPLLRKNSSYSQEEVC